MNNQLEPVDYAKVVANLEKMQEWFSDPAHFCQGAFGFSVHGASISDGILARLGQGPYQGVEVVSMCAEGALAYATGQIGPGNAEYQATRRLLHAAGLEVYNRVKGLQVFPREYVALSTVNDTLGLDAVRSMITGARELALQEQDKEQTNGDAISGQ